MDGHKEGGKFHPHTKHQSTIHASDIKQNTIKVKNSEKPVTIGGKRYCGGNSGRCLNALKKGETKCMWCKGYHKEEEGFTGETNRFGKIRKWKWMKN